MFWWLYQKDAEEDEAMETPRMGGSPRYRNVLGVWGVELMKIHKVNVWGALGLAGTKCGIVVDNKRVALTYKGTDCRNCLKTRPKPKRVQVNTEGIT
ncbi:MAG: hypothetical protein KAR06_08875 [Deltaproteobacteria bacterium]|nr:hypothetical protein [Deltaproteobacteria bacterium]